MSPAESLKVRRCFPVSISRHVRLCFPKVDCAFVPFDDSAFSMRGCQSISDGCLFPARALKNTNKNNNSKKEKACTKTITYEMNEPGGYITGFHVPLLLCPLPLSRPSAQLLRQRSKFSRSGFPSPAFSAQSDPRRRAGQMGRGPIVMDERREDAARKCAHLQLLCRTVCARGCTDMCTRSL